ncbi:MAG: hypothetical protein ACK53Q_22275 [Dolichospermum sp.]|jgi:hypothetical protein
MELKEAIGILEQVQELITPVLENAQDLIDEEFKNNISTIANLVNICAEDLEDKDCLEDLFRG